ncbi:MAG: oligoribonuclease [Mariprofundus sp.]|nr:oligoribonuclease [Mariprofundus sp.]
MTISADNLLWMDLEMTGLEPDHDMIIEIATIITDGQLNILAECPGIAIHQSQELMNGMDDWNTVHHGNSGLTDRVISSTTSMAEAEQQTLDFIRQYIAEGASPLCGNSVHQDRRFLYLQMPHLEAYAHYRNIDVSTIKELASRWYPKNRAPVKHSEHQALSDIRGSIKELVWYRKNLFR